jgi:hypothetical protein
MRCYRKNHITHCYMINVQLDLRIILCSWSCYMYAQLYPNIIYSYSLTTDIGKHIVIRTAIQRKVSVQRKRTGKVQQFACHDCKFQLEWADLKIKIVYVSSIHPLEYQNSKLQSNYIQLFIHKETQPASQGEVSSHLRHAQRRRVHNCNIPRQHVSAYAMPMEHQCERPLRSAPINLFDIPLACY